MEAGLLLINIAGGIGCLLGIGVYSLSLFSALILQRLEDFSDVPSQTQRWPKLSVVVPACNEEGTLEAAMTSLRGVDYPELEVILVNDRSDDGTGAIMDKIVAEDKRFQTCHITELPEGWLGKVNALRRGTELADGDFLLFIDADVHFVPSTLRRAVNRMQEENLGHLTVMPRLLQHGLPYNLTLASFALLFLTGVRAWKFRNPDSDAYAGVGAFAMIRREAFERTPGWEWLRMEIADDVGLGMLMTRKAGARSRLVIGTESVHLDWYDGLSSLVKGLEKNLFGAACHYSLLRTVAVLGGFIAVFAGPWVAALGPMLLGAGPQWGLIALAASVVSLALLVATVFRSIHLPFFATLFSSLGFLVLSWALIRSTLQTLRQGGVSWRDRFYPVDELKAGRRVDL